METTWDDLPSEMKNEVFKKLNVHDRFHVAKSSLGMFYDVFENQTSGMKIYFGKRKVVGMKNRIENSYLLSFGGRGKTCRIEMYFEKYRDSCDIRWKWGGNAFPNKIIDTKDIKKVAIEHFESILLRFKSSLEILVLKEIDVDFRNFAIERFPYLKFLQITTSKEKTLYPLLSISPNLESLKLSFRRFEEPDPERESDWSLPKLRRLEMGTNVKSIAENIVRRSENVIAPKFKFYGDDLPGKNSVVFSVRSAKFQLDTSLCLNSQQFHRLLRHRYEYVRCSRGKITNGGIKSMIQIIMSSEPKRGFCIHHVNPNILRARSFNFMLVDTKRDPRTGRSVECEPYYKYEHRSNARVGVLSYYNETKVLTFEFRPREIQPLHRMGFPNHIFEYQFEDEEDDEDEEIDDLIDLMRILQRQFHRL